MAFFPWMDGCKFEQGYFVFCRSFYVGDAAGRKGDHSDADIKFAEVVDSYPKIVIKTCSTDVHDFFSTLKVFVNFS